MLPDELQQRFYAALSPRRNNALAILRVSVAVFGTRDHVDTLKSALAAIYTAISPVRACKMHSPTSL